MAHNINIDEQTGKASIFVVREPAWHGLGQVVDNPLTAVEAIEQAGLDWEVSKKPIYINVDSGQLEVPGKSAIVRMDNNAVLGVVGRNYVPVQNKEAFTFFDHLVSEKEAIYHSAGVLGKGEITWILAKLPTDIVIGRDDLVENYVLVYDSKDGSSAVSAMMTPVRVVCNNTLTAAVNGARFKVSIRHTKSVVERLREAHKLLGLANRYRVEIEGAFNLMATKSVSKELVNQFLCRVYDVVDPEGNLIEQAGKTKESILEIFESSAGGQDLVTCRGTMFGLYNALTFYYDNVSSYKDENSRAYATWFGNSTTMRNRAMKVAMDMV